MLHTNVDTSFEIGTKAIKGTEAKDTESSPELPYLKQFYKQF